MYDKGLTDSPKCKQCNIDVDESVQHVMLHCQRYQNERDILKQNLYNLGIQDISLKNMLGGADTDPHILKAINREVGIFIETAIRYKEL